MKLFEIINTISNTPDISITGFADGYTGGLKALKCEPWYQEHKTDRVESVAVLVNGFLNPEISIVLDNSRG